MLVLETMPSDVGVLLAAKVICVGLVTPSFKVVCASSNEI